MSVDLVVRSMICGHCVHVHRVLVEDRWGQRRVDDRPCPCGCEEEGWRYDHGPTILDAPMLASS